MVTINLLNASLQSTQSIRAELSGDWELSEPPEFFIEPEAIELVSVEFADLWKFAETSAYFIDEDSIHFFCSQKLLAQNQLEEGDPVFLAGDFNGWDKAIGKKKWSLGKAKTGEPSGLKLSIPLSKIDFSKGSGFKFVSHEGHWFSQPSDATNVYDDGHGNSNYYVDHKRTGRHLFEIETSEAINLAGDYSLRMRFGENASSAAIIPGAFFFKTESKLSLGAMPYGNNTLFRIFAPRASEVTLVLLQTPGDWDNKNCHSLIQVGDGVWEVVIDQNLTGMFYWYRIDGPSQSGFSSFNPDFNVLDPYALASVGHLGPAIVVDPENYDPPQPFSGPPESELVIGEVHLRDLIAKAPGKFTDKDRLGFSGLTQWLRSDDCYIKEWGVNAIEFQPIQENDAHSKEEYHWGYMTVNYFSPHSGYATDSKKAAQVAEFKELVDAFHEAGLAVILDVVYNHVGEPAHLLFVDKLYYFELAADGSLKNWSGCGNDLRCSTPMGRRLIIDSLLHFIEFYGVDGFRFDLAELLGLDTLHEIETAVREKHPSVYLIAEPWSFRGHLGSDLKHTSYFSWNDGYRDFLKSYVLGKGNQESLQYFLSGSPESVGKPYQTVNYTESHDDRTWLDDITQNPGHNGYFPQSIDRRRTHLMVSILMMSLGTPLIAQGQDFLRSKWGVKNTYQRGDINALDYQRRLDFSSTHSYFRGWMEFRRSEQASCLRLEEFPASGFYEFFPAASGHGMGVLYNALETEGSTQLFFVVNPMTDATRIEAPGLDLDRDWVQLADSERFDPDGLRTALIPIAADLTLSSLSCALWIS